MGINVRVQNAPKPYRVVTRQVKFEKDLRSCMRCKFFYGNNSQCLTKKCIKEKENEYEPGITEQDREDICFGCPYKQSEGYCFPCMKKLLERKGTEEIVLEQEEKKDG